MAQDNLPRRRRWPKANRLASNEEIRRTIKQGARFPGDCLRFFFWPRPPGKTRFAVAIRKKVGTAVVRNRERRCWREAIRTARELWPEHGWGVVIIDRAAPEKTGRERQKMITGLLRRAGQLPNNRFHDK